MQIEKDNINNSFNYNGLPCVYAKGKYFLFDPYSIKAASFKEKKKLFEQETINKLTETGFVLNNYAEFHQKKNEKHYTFILTTDCNLACDYCYTQSKNEKKYLDANLAINIFEQTTEKYDQQLFIQYFGGEPSLNFSTLRKITEYIKSKNDKAFFYITTNGVMPDNVLKYLCDNNFGFYLSIDGTKEYHDLSRKTLENGGSYDNVINTLDVILSKKLSVKIRTTVTEKNVENMPTFAEQLFLKGAKLLHFAPIVKVGNAKDYSDFQCERFQDQFIENLSIVLDLAKKYNAKVITPISLSLKRPLLPYCKIFDDTQKIIITPEGKQTLCFGAQGEFNPISNKFVFASFKSNPNSIEYNYSIKEELLSSFQANLKNNCKLCFAQFFCQGGCFAENFAENKSFTILNQDWCNFNRKIAYFLIMRIIEN